MSILSVNSKESQLTIASLGWGVQSFAMILMSAKGMLPPLDLAVHSDTTHERTETYTLAKKWTSWIISHGIPLVTVDDAGAANQILDDSGRAHAPLYTISPSGKRGQLRRSCTQRWKIAPMRRRVSKELSRRSLKKTPGVVEKWLGITLDEAARMRQSDVKYVALRYPLIEMLDRPWTRGMVIDWLQREGFDVPVKSSCVFCPYHDKDTWREIKLSGNGDWERAVEVDKIIRNKRPGYLSYICAARQPLDEIDFRSQEDHGQLSMWDEECSGMCFL